MPVDNVFHIVESTATGTLTMLRLSANSQAEIGNQVTVIYSRRPETPSNLHELFHSDVELSNIQMDGIANKLKSFIELRKRLRSCKPDVIFLHSSFAGFIGRMASLGLTGRYFYLPHCISLMRRDISPPMRLLFAALEWMGALKSAVYVACSESEGAVVRRYIPFRRCKVIENAVDVNGWLYSGEWEGRESLVVTVGQIRLQKDPKRFAAIARKVLAAGHDVRFVWVGDGDAQYKSELQSAGVDVTGWRRPDEVKAMLQGSRYYLSTSLWEGMPVSPIEAMLSGCFAFLSDCAGNVDVVVDGKTGVLFDSVEGAVSKILRALESPSGCREIANAGREHCREKYAMERYISDFEKLLSDGK